MDIDDDRIKDITLREERRFELACLVWLSTAGAWTHSQHESTECCVCIYWKKGHQQLATVDDGQNFKKTYLTS